LPIAFCSKPLVTISRDSCEECHVPALVRTPDRPVHSTVTAVVTLLTISLSLLQNHSKVAPENKCCVKRKGSCCSVCSHTVYVDLEIYIRTVNELTAFLNPGERCSRLLKTLVPIYRNKWNHVLQQGWSSHSLWAECCPWHSIMVP